MKYTPENVIQNLENIGSWSTFYLAEIALKHYFPEEFDKNGDCSAGKLVMLNSKLGCDYWQDVIIKYQNEIGYDNSDFIPEYVNEH